jgi:hypothetical protein
MRMDRWSGAANGPAFKFCDTVKISDDLKKK